MAVKSYLLLPPEAASEPDRNLDLVPELVAGYVALWHPMLLHEAEELPRLWDVNDLPPGSDYVLAIPRSVFESLSTLLRNDLAERRPLLIIEPQQTSNADLAEILRPLALAAGDPERLLDFHALGFAVLGLRVLYQRMGQTDPVDAATFTETVRQAAAAYAAGDSEGVYQALQAAFDLLYNARQVVYPATINWVDLCLYPPGATLDELERRTNWLAPWNLILTGREVAEMAERTPAMLERLREEFSNNRMEILGGMEQPGALTLLPHESRLWHLARAAATYKNHFWRDVDSFGARTFSLAGDLPRLLMKFSYRYALHAAFDASRIPHFREPKIQWTGADGSVIEALARTALDATSDRAGLAVFTALAQTVMQDRSAVVVLAHWLSAGAAWYQWLLRLNQFAAVFGKFESLSEYFLNSSITEGPTQTRIDEYRSNAVAAVVARGEANPISRFQDHYRRRGQFDAVRSLAALEQLLRPEPVASLTELEDAVEAGSASAEAEIDRRRAQALEHLVGTTLQGAPAAPGYLLFNPSSFARRACVALNGLQDSIPIDAPIRAQQLTPAGSLVVVDVPAWGYAWVPGQTSASRAAPAKTAPLASGRQLRNDYLCTEIDAKSGGIRGVWEIRSGYSRLGQQLVYSGGSKMVSKRLDIVAKGPACGEIVTAGELVADTGRKTLARFEQRVRLWLGRPQVELTVTLEPLITLAGPSADEYFGCRWAWPDEKSAVRAGSAYFIGPTRAADLEAPELLEFRERHLITDVLPHGLPQHKRIGYRMADTLLLAAGESRRTFHFSIALDLANPWSAVQEELWPLGIERVAHGPPAPGRTGWLIRLSEGNIIASHLAPLGGEQVGLRLGLVETAGQSTHATLRFCKNPTAARLVNGRGELLFDLHVDEDRLAVDFSPHEFLLVEVLF